MGVHPEGPLPIDPGPPTPSSYGRPRRLSRRPAIFPPPPPRPPPRYVVPPGGARMERDDRDARLSRISTEWDLIFQAHGGPPEAVTAAQTALMTRYAGAVHRYLLG